MFRNLLSVLSGFCAIINQNDSDSSASTMFSKHSKRVVKNVDDRPCLGCYEAAGVQTRASLARSRSPDGYPERNARNRSAKSSSSISRAEDLLSPPSNRSNAGILINHTCSSASTCRRRHRGTEPLSVHFETSSSWKETPPTHRYNLRSSPSWEMNEQPRFAESMSRANSANSANAASWMYDDDPGDYDLDENSNVIPKAGMVSSMKRSYEERHERQSMMSPQSRSGTYLLTKERTERPSMMSPQSRSASYLRAREPRLNPFQYYLLKLSILWWQMIDYLTNDLFNYYNRVRIGGMLLVLLMVLVAHAVLHNVLITEDHQKQIAALACDLFRLFPPQNWSAITARIGSKVLDVF